MNGTPAERFWAKVDRLGPDECWAWLGTKSREGYGRFYNGTRMMPAHRFAYELLRGPIPSQLVTDHLCRNHSCVNPAHLEPVTNRVNLLRGEGPTATHAQKTHCMRGHPFAGSNLRIKAGSRVCVECLKVHRQNLRNRRLEALGPLNGCGHRLSPPSGLVVVPREALERVREALNDWLENGVHVHDMPATHGEHTDASDRATLAALEGLLKP